MPSWFNKHWKRDFLLSGLKHIGNSADAYWPGYNKLYDKHQKFWIKKLYPVKKHGTSEATMATSRRRGRSTVRSTSAKRQRARTRSGSGGARAAPRSRSRSRAASTTSQQVLGKYNTSGNTTFFKRKKFNAKKYAKKMGSMQEPQKFIRQVAGTTTNTQGAQEMDFVNPLCSVYGSSGFDDLFDIATVINDNVTGQTYPANTEFNNKYKIVNAHQELEITNTASTTTGGVAGNAVVDIYEWVCKRDIKYSALNTGFNVNSNLPKWTSGVTVTSDRIGVTPFDLPTAVEHMTFKKKTELIIEPGQTAVLHMNVKNKFYNGADLTESAATAGIQLGWKGLTRGFCIVLNGQKSSASGGEVVTLSWLMSNTYIIRPIASKVHSYTCQGL